MNPLQLYIHMLLATALIIFFLQTLYYDGVIFDEQSMLIIVFGSAFWPLTWLWFILCAMLWVSSCIAELGRKIRTRS